MVDATDTLPISTATSRVRSGKLGRLLALFVVIIVAGVVMVGAGNVRLGSFHLQPRRHGGDGGSLRVRA